MGKKWKQWQIFLGSTITVDGDCSHEIKRHLLLGRTAISPVSYVHGIYQARILEWVAISFSRNDKPRQHIKSRDITLLTKVCLVKPMVFLVVMYGCESWIIKKAERWGTDTFKLCWRGLLRVPWTARSNRLILKEINPEYSLEGLMLKLKLQYFWLPDAKS